MTVLDIIAWLVIGGVVSAGIYILGRILIEDPQLFINMFGVPLAIFSFIWALVHLFVGQYS